MNAGSRILEAFGGVRWAPASKAAELICTETGCGEDEAIDALCVWVKDGRVAARGPNIRLSAALGIANLLHPGPSLRSVALDLYEFDMHALRELLARSDSPHPGKPHRDRKRSGRLPKYDWANVELALEKECSLQESVPRDDHSDRAWRSQADACRLVQDQFGWKHGGPADSTLKARVQSMLERIEKRMAGN
jgi:hypothetical protein